MHYFFNDKINIDNINTLIKTIDVNENVTLYFSTSGGSPMAADYLIDFLNTKKDNITIVITNQLQSCGVNLLLDFLGNIELDLDHLDFILFHIADREMYSLRKDSYNENIKKIKEQDKEYNEKTYRKIKDKKLLTAKQLLDFKKGKDVYVYKSQFINWNIKTLTNDIHI
jgi:hypothetical protein